MSEIVFPASWKLAWIEQVATDHDCTDGQVRLAVGISRKLGKDGVAIVTQSTLANTIGSTERGVRKAAVGLQARAHLEVNSVGCGPGTATTYRPLVKRRNESAGVARQQGQEHLHFRSGEHRLFRSGETRNEEARTPERRSANTGSFVPPHKIPSKIPTKTPSGRAGANPASADPLQVSWWAIKERLAQPERWGEAKVEAWLDKLAVHDLTAGVLTLIAADKFIASYNTAQHEDSILAEWRALDPSVSHVRIEWRSAAPRANAAAIEDAPAESADPRIAFLNKMQGG